MEVRSPSKIGQDEARFLGKTAAELGASKAVVDRMKDKYCNDQHERDAFDKGLKEGKG
jgi:hypothetical protein